MKLSMQSLVCFPDMAQSGSASPVSISRWGSDEVSHFTHQFPIRATRSSDLYFTIPYLCKACISGY